MAAGTIGDLLIKLGIGKDKKSFNDAEKGVKALAQNAKKLLATIGVGLSLRKIWQMLKQTENIKNAIDEVKKTWKGVWEQFDKTTGTTKVIAKWIKTASNYLLSLFRKVEPFLKSTMKALGGTENSLKTILAIAMSFSAVKSLDKALGLKLSKGKIAVLIAVLYALYLVIEDIVYFVQGKGSLLGELCKKYGVDVDKLRARIKGIITKAKTFLTNTFGRIRDTLGKVFQKIGKAAEKAFVIIKDFWEKHGEKIAKNLKDAWDTLTDSFERIKKALEPFVNNLKEAIDLMLGGKSSSDIWEAIGNAIEKASEYLSPAIEKFADFALKVADFLSKVEPEQIISILKGIAAAIGAIVAIKAGNSVLGLFAKGAFSIGKFADGINKISSSGGLLKMFGSGILEKLKSIPAFFSNIGKAAKALFGLLGIKGILIIAGIALIIAGIILLIKNWDKIKPAVQKVLDKVKEFFTNVGEKLTALKEKISNKFSEIKEKIKGVFQSIKDFISNHIVAIMTIIIGPIGGLIAFIIKNKDEIKAKIDEIREKVSEVMSNIKGAYEEHIKPIFDWIHGKIDALVQKIANSKVGQWIAEKFGIDLSDSEESVEESASNIETTMNDTADGAYDSGLDYSNNLASGIRAGLPNVQAASGEIANAMSEQTHFSVPDKGPLKDQDKWGGHFVANLVSGLRNSLPKLRAAAGTVASALGLDSDLTARMQKTTNLVAGASSTTVINQNNNWTNNFNGDQSAAFAQSVNNQEAQASQSLGNRLAYLR